MPISYIYWDPTPQIFVLPVLHWPILWYGFLFALGFILGFPLFVNLLVRYFLAYSPGDDPVALKKLAVYLTDRLTVYMVVATVVGARLGHFLFYEKPSDYLNHLSEILRTWEGGLSSHGAAIGIILAIVLFAHRHREKLRGLGAIHLLDFVAVPTALAGSFIRIGNFFNQEILGTRTTVPWAVIFGHPADRSAPAPRHPVQLYEAAAYLAVFVLLWFLSYRKAFLLKEGRLISLFFVLVFGFRFIVEFWKEEQSRLIPMGLDLTMGQLLSIPAVIAGLLLYIYSTKR